VRVLVISAAFPPMRAGEATNAYHVCQRLSRRGLDVHVLTSVGHDAVSDPGITVHARMRSWSWSEAPRLVDCVRRITPDAVYLVYLGWTYGRQFMSTFIPTLAKRAAPRAPFVTRFENVAGAGPQSNGWMSRAIRKGVALLDRRGHVDYEFGTLLRDSDAIVLLSSRHEAIVEERLPGAARKCRVIPPPSNMCMSPDDAATRARGRRALGAEPDDFVVAYIGFLYPGKGVETLLAAAGALRTERPKLRLAIIGGALESLKTEYPDRANYVEELHGRASELGIADRIAWTGEYSFDDDRASVYLRSADACVLPFDTGVKMNNSSFSSAAAHGLPIVTTRDDRLEPQFIDEENVLLCPPKSPEAVAGAIRRLMGDAPLRGRLAAGARRFAADWYSWDTAVERTVSLFQNP
jgi:glycosyltransferase involved in cell wall biosynthesis